MKLKTFICCTMFACALLNGGEIKGVGYGKDEGESKKYALSDLSSFIEVEVQSKFESMLAEVSKNGKNAASEFSSSFVKVKSELPVLGAEYKTSKMKSSFYSEALLDPAKVLKLYESKLSDIKKNIDKNSELLNKASNNASKLDILKNLLTDIAQYNKFKIVAVFLDSKNIPEISITEAEIKNRILEISQNIDSLDFAAKSIGEQIKQTGIYVYPVTTKNSKEITQFASALKDYVSKYIKVVLSPDKASFFLKGDYIVLKDGIDVTYQILDVNFNIINTYIVKLLPKAYEGYEIEPKNLDFTKLLEEGLVISNDFKIDITTNFGKTDLLFKGKEEVEVLVKLNKPGYFYAVGHVNKDAEKYSYLLEIDPDVEGNRKFIFYMNPDDVNKWVSIGTFEVCPPYGLESLQLIASNKDLVDSIPGTTYDDEMGYYILSNDPIKNVSNTRGLKKQKTKEVLSSENILLFTTIEK